MDIPNFVPIRLDHQIDKRGGGIIIYIRKDILFTTLSPDLNFSNSNIECLPVKLYNTYQQPFFVNTVYIPPKADTSAAIETLIQLYEKLQFSNETWFLGGDYIKNYIDNTSKSNKSSLNALHQLERHCLIEQQIKKTTRFSATSKTVLDLIYTNKSHLISHSGVIGYSLSDHELTYCIYKKSIPPLNTPHSKRDA